MVREVCTPTTALPPAVPPRHVSDTPRRVAAVEALNGDSGCASLEDGFFIHLHKEALQWGGVRSSAITSSYLHHRTHLYGKGSSIAQLQVFVSPPPRQVAPQGALHGRNGALALLVERVPRREQ